MWIRGQGRTVHVHGDSLSGQDGIWLAQGQVKGLWDAPVKTTWKTGAFTEGSKLRNVKKLHRDMDIGFHCIESPGRSMEENESDFRKMFEYQEDPWDDDPQPTSIGVETEISGIRMIDVLMYDTPLFEPDIDPIKQQYINLIMKLRAGAPMWYEPDPATNKPYQSVFSSDATNAAGWIEVYNPTDQPMRHKWILTRGKWEIPDVSWVGRKYNRRPGGAYADRALSMPEITATQGGCWIDLDNSKLQVRDAHYTNLLPLMGGKFFKHIIPPYTPKTLLPISYTGAPAGGAMAILVQPHNWSRPWGLE
jgi:hypothetical protein